MGKANVLCSLLEAYGIAGVPKGLDSVFDEFAAKWQPQPLLQRDFLTSLCRRFAPGEAAEKRLFAALDEIESDDALLTLSAFLVKDMCRARYRLDCDDYKVKTSKSGMKHADLFPFLLLIACIEPSMQRLKKIGVPIERYEAIPFIPTEKQMMKLRDSGVGTVADFPWDMNFYTCSLFRIKRFNFIPFKLDDDIIVYRRGIETKAFFSTSVMVRRDGMLNGVNGLIDSEAFEAIIDIEGDKLTGYPILPAGVISNQTVTLNLNEWNPVLKKGDTLLGFHIPGDKGYDPDHMRENSIEAFELFNRYFPEIDIKGIGSESWLHDPHVAYLLEGKGNIPDMQKQMYIYPIKSGDGMMWQILFGGKKPLAELPRDTRLQRAAADYIERGGRLTVCSFFTLKEDLHRVGNNPYRAAEEYSAVWDKMETIWPFTAVEGAATQS